MRMRVIHDYDCDKLWFSRWIDRGDFPFLFAIKLEYLEDHGEEIVKSLGKYIVSVRAVSPAAAGEENVKQALRSCGWEGMPDSQEAIAEVLLDYGTYATLGEFHGNNVKSLLKQARECLRESDMFFGFKMDRAQNRIGSTGWDFIRGDILAGLATCQTPESAIMRKMHGMPEGSAE